LNPFLNQIVFKNFLPRRAFILLVFEHISNNILNLVGSRRIFREFKWFISDILEETSLGISCPGGFPIEHLIENYTDTPHIAFTAEHSTLQDLGTHVEWGSQTRDEGGVVHAGFKHSRKSEIGYLRNSIMEHYIGWLDISVNNTFIVEFSETLDDVSVEK
jgi:hypothetical protein